MPYVLLVSFQRSIVALWCGSSVNTAAGLSIFNERFMKLVKLATFSIFPFKVISSAPSNFINENILSTCIELYINKETFSQSFIPLKGRSISAIEPNISDPDTSSILNNKYIPTSVYPKKNS